MFKIYFARPMTGTKFSKPYDYFKKMSDIFLQIPNVYILHCIVGKENIDKDHLLKGSNHGFKIPCATDHAILQRDLWMVEQADLVFVNLLNTDRVSIGCCMELAIAHWLRKHTVVVIQKGNIHEHAFILETADVIFDNETDAVEYIQNLILSRTRKEK